MPSQRPDPRGSRADGVDCFLRPMPPLECDAIVLRCFDFGETSRIVVLLTRERGKLRAVAKGARGRRSRLQGSLEPLSELRVGLYGRQGAELFRLGGCELLASAFSGAGQGLEPALFLSYAAELLDAFCPEHQADERMYRLARAVVHALREGIDATVLARYLEAWLLRLSGLYPPLDACASCGGPLESGALRYHRAAHGFVCENCGSASGPVLPAGARAFLNAVFLRAPVELSGPLPMEASTLETFHHDLITAHLERTLHSFRILKDVARLGGGTSS
jgi:DNA repair protein RecO (recombination protein O)